ncbi:MAG: alanine racemase [Xanthobacteraceae bacterium]
MSAVVALAEQGARATVEPVAKQVIEQATEKATERLSESGPLLISSSSEIHGSVRSDTIVQRNCTLHVRGNLLGTLTIEPGASVVVDGSVDGRIINKGGRLLVHNKGLAACVTVEGPVEAEACGTLKINLTNLAANYERLAKRTEAECAAVVRADAYGCGIGPIAGALWKSGCNTFFVSNLAEAKSVRAVAPQAAIYVLNGFCSGAGAAFADINARPVINSAIELAEWDVFVGAQAWEGGCALNVDTSLSIEEATAFAPRVQSLNHGVALLLSRLNHAAAPDDPRNERQLETFRELRRLYRGIPASLADSSGIFLGSKAHFDLVRAGSALYGINPTPRTANPMLPVIELSARIVQVRELSAPASDNGARAKNGVKRRTRLALVSLGHADGYPRPAGDSATPLQVVIGGRRCRVAAAPSIDLLPIDVTDLDRSVARFGAMVTLIGDGFAIDDLAAASGSTGREILSRLGRRFHRIYYAT